MDTDQWRQETNVKPIMEEIVTSKCSSLTKITSDLSTKQTSSSEANVSIHQNQALNCPRCNSTKTKFCYYNNYSLTQPRYFCKSCRRYWTKGGSLRNIPFGGGSRKNKRSSSSSSNSSTKIIDLPDLVASNSSERLISINTRKIHHWKDLNLRFTQNPEYRGISEFIQFPLREITPPKSKIPMNSASTSALELLNGLTSSSGIMPSYMPMPISDPNTIFSSGFSLQSDFKPTLSFDLGLIESGHGNNSLQELKERSNGMLLFPFTDDLKQISNTSDHTDSEQSREINGDSTGFWRRMLGGGAGSR
ncbi:hypothetical protein Nepgr_024473 [Nepenthes gracilis]|uniref:Dof zinc finger protein n=1 Tax=Nepenthes gracilis TaxID=150966 RepID=A0AAD3T4A6_NEPGR|nr:hypothetical protein Nepgr_024473 [Nepenthes gracilis]